MKIKKVCDLHGEYESEQKEVLGFVFETCCPMCEQEQIEKEHLQEIAEERQTRLEEYKKMNIEPEYYGASFNNYEPETESQKQALESCIRLVSGELKKVVLLGSNGVGKTHLASATVKATRGKLLSMFEMGLFIRSAYSSGGDEFEKLDLLARLPMLAIDEMGRTKNSDAERNYLSYILDKRHTRGLPTLLISNFHLQKNCKKGNCERCFENLIDNDIVSRFKSNTAIVDIVGKDKRGNR